MSFKVFTLLFLFSISPLTYSNCIDKAENILVSNKIQRVTSKMDDLNGSYFKILLDKKGKSNESGTIKIASRDITPEENDVLVYPTAMASEDLMRSLPTFHYDQINNSENRKAAKNVSLWVKKMQAGTGSSLTRTEYLAQTLNISANDVKIGAKGTDLFISIKHPLTGENTTISLAEAQIIQLIYISKANKYSNILVHDIVGPETKKSLKEIWDKKSIINPSKSYRELLEESNKINYSGTTFQGHLPTLTPENEITFERQAPGGHGIFALEAIMAAYKPELRPKSKNTLISSIGNGEDLSSIPDENIVGLMKREKIAVAMITTTKTENDLKGGQIAIAKTADNETYTTIVEKAQAEQSNQLELFEALGLREKDNIAFFNTNMALFNYEVLTPKVNQLIELLGEDKFLQEISPDLIQNWKEQNGKKFLQLEGAMGSVILNLDRLYRKHFHEPLVSFINIEREKRTNFFSPIKTAFDFVLQFKSDRFKLNNKTMQLINNRPGVLPSISLSHKYYKDLSNTINAFNNTSLLKLDSLKVDGLVHFSDLELIGKIEVINKSDSLVDLSLFLKSVTIKDQKIIINEDLEISVEQITK